MSDVRIYQDLHVISPQTKRVQLDGRAQYIPDGVEEVTYDVYLDSATVAMMAKKAAHSKGGKCLDGALRVVVTKRKKVE